MAARTTPLGLSLDLGSHDPLYHQLFAALAGRIREGTLPSGFRLPPTRELAKELGTHRNTVVRAYGDLERAGYVRSTVGRGTFVVSPPDGAVPDAPPARPPLPWASLTARVLSAEALGRAERLPRPAPGKDVVDLTRMQPADELLPHELFGRCVQHVLRTRGARALGYSPRDGVPRLREQIARDLARLGVPASPDDVLVTSGSQQALDLVVRALVDPGERLVTHGATYSGALRVFAVAGARVVAAPEDEHGPLPDGLRSSGAGARLLYLMPNHVNPTGTYVPRARREALVAWSHDASVPILEDDYAADLVLDDVPRDPPLRALSGDVIHVGTYSKRLIPSLRIGYVVCPPRLRAHLANMKHAVDLGCPGLLQHSLAEFLERDWLVPHVAGTRLAYVERRDAFETALRRHLPSDVRFRHAARGITLWLDLPDDVSPDAVYEEALRQGVLVSPGSQHRVDGGRAHGLRVNFCYEPVARLREGAKRLGRALDAVRSESRKTREPAPSMTVM